MLHLPADKFQVTYESVEDDQFLYRRSGTVSRWDYIRRHEVGYQGFSDVWEGEWVVGCIWTIDQDDMTGAASCLPRSQFLEDLYRAIDDVLAGPRTESKTPIAGLDATCYQATGPLASGTLCLVDTVPVEMDLQTLEAGRLKLSIVAVESLDTDEDLSGLPTGDHASPTELVPLCELSLPPFAALDDLVAKCDEG